MSTLTVSSTSNINLTPEFLNLDRQRKIIPISDWILTYFSEHPQQNLAQMEVALRTHNCFTHLIAESLETNGNFRSIWPHKESPPRKYALFISTKDSTEAAIERNRIAGTEEENLTKLALCGFKAAKVYSDVLSCLREPGDEVQLADGRILMVTPMGSIMQLRAVNGAFRIFGSVDIDLIGRIRNPHSS